MERKSIYLSPEVSERFSEIKKKHSLKSDGQTVSYLIQKYDEDKEELAMAIRKELEENYLPKERIRWGVQTAEQNSVMILDALNTLLWMMNAKKCYRADEIIHPVIKESQEELKRKIAYFKQKSDERKSKMGIEES